MANGESQQAGGNGTNEYLTFRLGGEEYGIDILRVQEIRGYDAVTPIINTPAFIKGVVNLRGTIVPIVDLRIKFAVGEATYDQFTVVIILNIGNRVVGIVVDSVSEVMELDPEQIRATPDLGTAVDTTYIRGLTSKDERMLIVLDIEKLMTSRDMGLMDETRLAA
ncbi:MAG: chemotaxis protein CheW [Burkholderiales bacterium]